MRLIMKAFTNVQPITDLAMPSTAELVYEERVCCAYYAYYYCIISSLRDLLYSFLFSEHDVVMTSFGMHLIYLHL